jgi:hypothetical protein
MAVIFSDTFEGGNLTNWSTAQSNWTAQQVTKYAGSYAAKGAYGASNRLLNRTLSPSLGNCIIKGMIYTDTIGARWYPFYPMATTNQRIYALLPHDDGHWKYWNGTAYANLPTDTTVTGGQWYNVEVILHFSASKIYWRIDGVYKGSATLKDFANTTLTSSHGISAIGLQNAASTSIGYVDNYSVSEWAPLGLIGDGLVQSGLLGQGILLR